MGLWSSPIQYFTALNKERKKRKYEQNKLKKIATFSQQYGIKKFGPYQFGNDEKKNEYLDTLKRTIMDERISMLGEHKLDTLRYCTEACLENNVEGDIIETGVWRGGATIYLTGILQANGNRDKTVYVADSFEGLPPPDEEKYPHDKGLTHHLRKDLAIPLEEVRDNFARFDLLSDRVVFVKGFFEDSLQDVKSERFSILRLDGDMYGSTMTVLKQLYHKLEIGGYLILDDWLISGARDALLDFREKMSIDDEMYEDFSGIFWQKNKKSEIPDW